MIVEDGGASQTSPGLLQTHPHGSTPVPDPTLLTTAALKHEISGLKELVMMRLDSVERAMVLFRENITRVPTDTDKQVGQLKEKVYETFRLNDALRDEKFSGLQHQISDRDARVAQTGAEQRRAVESALIAAEKAVRAQTETFAASISKSENATAKQIDQQSTLLATATDGLRTQSDDIKSRITIVESETRGKKDEGEHRTTQTTSIVGMAGFVVGALGVIGGLFFSYTATGRGSNAPVAAVAQQTSPPQIIYVPIPPPIK